MPHLNMFKEYQEERSAKLAVAVHRGVREVEKTALLLCGVIM